MIHQNKKMRSYTQKQRAGPGARPGFPDLKLLAVRWRAICCVAAAQGDGQAPSKRDLRVPGAVRTPSWGKWGWVSTWTHGLAFPAAITFETFSPAPMLMQVPCCRRHPWCSALPPMKEQVSAARLWR